MLSILLGFLGYSVMNISQAFQKIGIGLRQKETMKGNLVWISGTVGTFIASIILFAAVALGSASLVGTMAGTGLASLAVFSHFVMKERIGLTGLAGIIIIAGSAGLIGFFSTSNPPSLIHLDFLFALLGMVVLAFCFLWILFNKKGSLAGIIIGSFSGSLGGFVLLFQKVATSDYGQSMSLFPVGGEGEKGFFQIILAMFSNPFALTWVLLSLTSIFILQFSYKKADAIRIIPFFSSSMIIIPVVGGVLCLSESLQPFQWGAIAVILCGLILLSLRGGRRGAVIS